MSIFTDKYSLNEREL